MPEELRWPFRFLDRVVGDQLQAWYSAEQIAEWKTQGLGDYEADEVCTKLGTHAASVFPGWSVAGLDGEVYP